MTHLSYDTDKSCCAKNIGIDFDDNSKEIISITFKSGCLGCHEVLKYLVLTKKDTSILKDLSCGSKTTSCAKELAKAIEKIS
jgi:hypothetical protein